MPECWTESTLRRETRAEKIGDIEIGIGIVYNITIIDRLLSLAPPMIVPSGLP
jgi:hypothetical protein